jgi:hypothetical protein
MLNREYTHLANLKAETIGGMLMEDLGGWLETSGSGVLQYCAHGGGVGETGGDAMGREKSDLLETLDWIESNPRWVTNRLIQVDRRRPGDDMGEQTVVVELRYTED